MVFLFFPLNYTNRTDTMVRMYVQLKRHILGRSPNANIHAEEKALSACKLSESRHKYAHVRGRGRFNDFSGRTGRAAGLICAQIAGPEGGEELGGRKSSA